MPCIGTREQQDQFYNHMSEVVSAMEEGDGERTAALVRSGVEQGLNMPYMAVEIAAKLDFALEDVAATFTSALDGDEDELTFPPIHEHALATQPA